MTESMRKYKKFIKVGLIIFIAILSLIYLKVFFQEGIIYNEVFLIREESPQGSNFQGKSKWGKRQLQPTFPPNSFYEIIPLI